MPYHGNIEGRGMAMTTNNTRSLQERARAAYVDSALRPLMLDLASTLDAKDAEIIRLTANLTAMTRLAASYDDDNDKYRSLLTEAVKALKPFEKLIDAYEAAKAGGEIRDWCEYIEDVAWPTENACCFARSTLTKLKAEIGGDMTHKLVGGTLKNTDDGIVAICECGWTSIHFSSLAASGAFMDHQQSADKIKAAGTQEK